jgi:hypothetical protein
MSLLQFLTQAKEPMELPRQTPAMPESIGYDSALHLLSLRKSDKERALYAEQLFERGLLSHEDALKLIEWVKQSPL